MADGEREIVTNSKDINYIKNKVFNMYPELRPYVNSCTLEREFGELEMCGLNKLIINISPKSKVEFSIVYCSEAG